MAFGTGGSHSRARAPSYGDGSRQRLRWRCVASARSDIRRPPVGQPLVLFFTIGLPFAGTDVASEAANERTNPSSEANSEPRTRQLSVVARALRRLPTRLGMSNPAPTHSGESARTRFWPTPTLPSVFSLVVRA